MKSHAPFDGFRRSDVAMDSEETRTDMKTTELTREYERDVYASRQRVRAEARLRAEAKSVQSAA